MLTRMVLLGVALLVCLGSSREGRESTQRRPVNDPGVCRASCRRFFACKGLNDAANEESCTSACAEGQVPGELALRIAQAEECGTVLALAEGGATPEAPPPGEPGAGEPAAGAGPAMTPPLGPAPVCPEPAASGEPALTKLISGRVWCAPGSPDGARAAERVVFHATGDAALVSVDQASAMPRSQVTACWRLEGTTLSFSRDGAAFAPVPVKVSKTAGKSHLQVGDRSYDDCTELP